MSSTRFVPAALAAFMLAGCTPVPAATPAVVAAAPAPATAQLRLRPRYEPAAPASRRLLATVSELTAARLHHVDVKLSVFDEGVETPVAETTLLQGELEDEITFSNLKQARTYKVRAYAHAYVDGVLRQVSLDGGSYKHIVVGTDDAPALDTLVVQLEAVAFAGRATSGGVDVQSGPIAHQGQESVTLDQD